MAGPDPFAASAQNGARGPRTSGEDKAPPKERLATLWVRPGGETTTGPIPISVSPAPVPHHGGAKRTALLVVLLLGTAALSVTAAVMVPRWLDEREAASAGERAVIQRPAPPPEVAVPAPAPESSPSPKAVKPAAPAKRAVAATAQAAARGALANPAPVDRRCVPNALRARPDLAGRLPGEIAVRFRVGASGDVARIEVLGQNGRDMSDAVAEAVRSCRFTPGTDEQGRPIALPIVMRIRFAAAPEATAGF